MKPNRAKEETLTHDEVRRLLSYDAETGFLTWNQDKSQRVRQGDRAGSITKYGYRRIFLKGVGFFMAHRLAWFHTHGEWPEPFLNHLNGDKDDNRLENLEKCTRSQNLQHAWDTGLRRKAA